MSQGDGMDMSRTNKSSEDEELSQLLNSSLHDFGKSSMNPSVEDGVDAADIGDDEFDPEAAQKAAAEFKIMLQQLAEVQKVVVKQMSSDGRSDSVNNAENQPFADSSSDNLPCSYSEQEDMQFAQTFLKSMQFLTEKAKDVEDAKSPEQLADALKCLSDDEAYENDFMPFMQGLMGNLLSKDLLYPSMKEMSDKFPHWLAENKSKLDDEAIARYEKQLKFMQEVCAEYENEVPDETDQQKAQRFDRLVVCMHKMQACGHPPEELIGAMPPGWNFDSQLGIPQVVEPEKAAEACCVM